MGRRKRRRGRRKGGKRFPEPNAPVGRAREEEEQALPLLSPEEFARLRDGFFATLDDRLAALKADVIQTMAPFDAFDVLTNLLIANLPLNVETYRESEHGGLIALVEYAGLILLERQSRAGEDLERLRLLDATVIEPLQTSLREMLNLSAMVAMDEVRTGRRGEPPTAIDDVRTRIAQRELFLRNPVYEWQELEALRGLFGGAPVAADLQATVGFDVEDAITFTQALWDIGFARFRERARISRDLATRLEADVVRVSGGRDPLEPEFAEVAASLATESKQRRKRLLQNLAIGFAWTRAGDAMQVTPADLAAETSRPDEAAAAFLEAFSVKFGELNPTLGLTGSHALRGRPIIDDGNGHYLCSYHGNVLFALRRRCEDALKPFEGDAESAARWERYNRARRRYAEQRAVDLLRQGLGTSLAWSNPTYAIAGGDRVEIDGLVVLDTVGLVVEAKGGALSQPARRALEPRLKRDVETILEEAASQANRLTSAIERGDEIHFWDADGQAIPLDHKELSRVFPIVVTVDDFSGLSTSVWSLVEAELLEAPEPLPWIVSLDELEIIVDLLDYAAQLPHFLTRRRRVNELTRISAGDELDFFVYYLHRGLYFEDMLEGPDAPDYIWFESMTDEVDAYYLWRRGQRRRKAPKPSMKLDPAARAMLDQLDKQRPPGFVEASIALLDMSDESRRELMKQVRRITKLSRDDGAFHDVTLSFVPSGGWGVTVASVPPSLTSELPKRLGSYVPLKKHQLGADRWIGFGIIVGEKGAFHALVVDYAPWQPDPDLDALVDDAFAIKPPIDQLSAKLRAHLEQGET